MFKTILYFRRRERIAIILLFIIILAIIAIINIDFHEYDDINTGELSKQQIRVSKEYASKDKQSPTPEFKNLKVFNPNTDSIDNLIAAGLPNKLAQNIVNYHLKGGRYRIKSDLKRLYTMNDSIYQLIEAYIDLPDSKPKQIKETAQPTKNRRLNNTQTYSKTYKYPIGTTISLNSADTTELKKIPKIGSYTASKICRYRERLGGFYTIKQLAEIDLEPADFEKWFKIDSQSVIKRDINKLDFKELLRHPYMSYEQVKTFFNYKRKHGDIRSFKQLQLLDNFEKSDLERLSIYFFCQ